MPVDVYGKCGTLKCGTEWYNNDRDHVSDQDCMQMLNQTYKFYLALENSVCKVAIFQCEAFLEVIMKLSKNNCKICQVSLVCQSSKVSPTI